MYNTYVLAHPFQTRATLARARSPAHTTNRRIRPHRPQARLADCFDFANAPFLVSCITSARFWRLSPLFKRYGLGLDRRGDGRGCGELVFKLVASWLRVRRQWWSRRSGRRRGNMESWGEVQNLEEQRTQSNSRHYCVGDQTWRQSCCCRCPCHNPCLDLLRQPTLIQFDSGAIGAPTNICTVHGVSNTLYHKESRGRGSSLDTQSILNILRHIEMASRRNAFTSILGSSGRNIAFKGGGELKQSVVPSGYISSWKWYNNNKNKNIEVAMFRKKH